MKAPDKKIIAWLILILISILVIYGCKSILQEQIPPVSEEVLPEAPPEILPPENAVAMPHEIQNFEDCTGCHYEEGSEEGATIVDEQHYCNACHDMSQPFQFNHGASPNESCRLCHRPQ